MARTSSSAALAAALAAALDARIAEVDDESADHAGHSNAGGGHYRALVVSEEFEGLERVDRHRRIHRALESCPVPVHALSIRAYTPAEWRRLDPSA